MRPKLAALLPEDLRQTNEELETEVRALTAEVNELRAKAKEPPLAEAPGGR